MPMQKRAKAVRAAATLFVAALCFVCLLVEPPRGVEPSLPDGSVHSSEGAVRVATKIAVQVSGSPEGSESL